MQAKWWIQFSIQGFLFLIGVGGMFVPEVKTWFYSGTIWGVATIWAIVTLVLWQRSRQLKPQVQNPGGVVIQSNKTKAEEIHTKLIELETELWKTRDSLSKNANAFNYAEIKEILAEIYKELTNLATKIKTGDKRKFENGVITDLHRIYPEYLFYHANAYQFPFYDDLRKIHSNIRWFIERIKD